MWKNRLKKLVFFVIIGIIGLILGNSIRKTYVNYAYKPYYWKSPPVIINCIGDELYESTIKNAIDYWDKRGHEILFYEYKKVDNICNSKDELDGFIILRKEESNLDPGVLASTYRNSNGYFEIKSVVIYFEKDTYNYYLLLEHEMGHAFGYSHKNKIGHIMNPYYDYMGDKF